MNGAIMGMSKAEITRKLDEIVDFSGVERYLDTPVKRYSSGMTVRLGFAIAAHLEPEILVVDEVLAVGDAEFQKKAIGKMQDVSKGEGRTVLFVSHNMQSIRKLCNNGVVLKNGSVDLIDGIDECIDHYILENDFGIISNVFISDKHRGGKTSMDLEFLQICLENENPSGISTNEPLSVIMKVRINNRNTKLFSIGLHIYDQDDLVVGSFMSNVYSVPNSFSEVFDMRLILRNHNLTLGKYKLQFNIGLKDLSSGIIDYDVLGDVLSFEVQYIDFETKKPYIVWHRKYWGDILFPDGEIQII